MPRARSPPSPPPARGSAHAGRTTQACALVVVGAVEEEAATSKGARFIASRFDGGSEPRPSACVIGEPSSWRRITLGYKGRLLLDLSARQAMAHTAGPDASVAEVVVDLWNWVRTPCRHRECRCGKAVRSAHAEPAPIHHRQRRRSDRYGRRTVRVAAAGGLRRPRVRPSSCWRGRPTTSTRRARCRRPRSDTGPGVDSPDHHRRPAHEPRVRVPRLGTALARRSSERARAQLPRRHPAVEPAAQPGFVVKTGTSDMNVVAPIWQCPIVAYGPGDSALDHTPMSTSSSTITGTPCGSWRRRCASSCCR